MEENNNPVWNIFMLTLLKKTHTLESTFYFNEIYNTIDNLLRYNNPTNYYPIFYKNARTIS